MEGGPERNLEFDLDEKSGEFISIQPNTKSEVSIKINKCSDCQVYAHDLIKQCQIDNCHSCSIVLGPVKGLCQINNSKDSKVVVFC